jgi:hypothetical protein
VCIPRRWRSGRGPQTVQPEALTRNADGVVGESMRTSRIELGPRTGRATFGSDVARRRLGAADR